MGLTMKRAGGFTILEIMVAMTISVAITGVALYAFNRLEHYRRIQDRRIRYAGQAEAFFSIAGRELSAVYAYGGEESFKTFEADASGVTFTTAIDGGEADHAQVRYYMEDDGLHRAVKRPGADDEETFLFAPDVRSIEVKTKPSPLPGGSIPEHVLVEITLPAAAEPDNPDADVTWSHYVRIENAAP